MTKKGINCDASHGNHNYCHCVCMGNETDRAHMHVG